MAQLFFRYGTMNASKTAQLLMVAHNYKEVGKKIIIFSPTIDDRYGQGIVKSRIGIQKNATPIKPDASQLEIFNIIIGQYPVSCILCDESQFLSEQNVLIFTKIVDTLNIPVICYGLLRDFKGKLFEGSRSLIQWADKIEEIKTICTYCGKKATHVLRFVDGKPVYSGEQIQIGDSEYKSVCRKHWFEPKI